jgi:long-chain fatty acid transport protein
VAVRGGANELGGPSNNLTIRQLFVAGVALRQHVEKHVEVQRSVHVAAIMSLAAKKTLSEFPESTALDQLGKFNPEVFAFYRGGLMREARDVRRVAVAAVLGASLAGTPCAALEGYFQHGYGARHKALAGAGVADGRDATIAALNPAGLVNVPNETIFGLGVFSPTREVDGSGPPGLTTSGHTESDKMYFPVPNSATSYRLGPNPFADVVAISFYGNGANTSYPAMARPDCLNGGTGMFCGGRTGIDFQQIFMTLAAAKQIMPGLSVGIGPVIGRQQFEAKGLGLFSDPMNVTDVAWGVGVRAGVQWAPMDGVRFGAAVVSRTYMERFGSYSTLIAEHGDCDGPANWQAGVAVDVRKDLTFMLDYQHISYSSVACVGNASTNFPGVPFGEDNGPGFGWRDIDAIKFGAEWRMSDVLTLRAGYSYNNSPIRPRDVQLNILTPAVTKHHLTAGAELALSEDWSLEVAGLYAPENTVSGYEVVGDPNHRIDISTRQYEVMFSLKYLYDNGSR